VEIVIDPRFNGPAGSANGGVTCGLLAQEVGEPAEITLRSPPPLGRPLRFDGERLWDGDELVAEAVAAEVDLEIPGPVSLDDAVEAARGYAGFAEHAFPTCFVCGPARDDGLGVFAGPVADDGLVASPWRPEQVSPELVWAALDCPGAFAVGIAGRGEVVLGRLAARVDRLPEPGEQCVVVGWPLGEDGRKLYAGTALYGAVGEPLARARATWIVPRQP
jgi:hypothetical protein